MKRLLVAVLVVAGCASKPPEEPPLPPGMVTVATFTAEADPAAGTFTIRTQPTSAGRAQGMAALAASDVVVENQGAPWFDSEETYGCPSGTRTWGANVKVTSLIPGDVWLGGVYAEITSFTGPAGSQGCNSAAAPEGLSSERGLWVYPTIGPLAAGAQTVTWAFGRVSAAAVTFSGRIVAAKVGVTDAFVSLPYAADQVIAVYDQTVVYSTTNDDAHGLQFVNFDGTSAGYSALPVAANAIAADFGDALIWFTAEGTPGIVGYVSGAVIGYTSDAGGELGGIVPDPTKPGRAWYRSNAGAYIRSVDVGVPPVIGLTDIDTAPYAPYGMAIGPGGNLYVTAPADDRILVFTTGEPGGDYVDDFDTGPGCAGPTSITQGPGGRMWFSAERSDAVCSFTTGSDVAPVNTADHPTQLAVGPDGKVWVAANDSNQVARMDVTGPGYRIDLFNAAGAFGLATGGNKLWAVDIFGVYPIELDPLTP